MILIPIRANFPILYCHFYDPPSGCYLHEFDEMLRQNYFVLTQPHHNIDLLSQPCGEAELFKSLVEEPIDLSNRKVVIEGVIDYIANTDSCLLLKGITCPKQRVLSVNLYKELLGDLLPDRPTVSELFDALNTVYAISLVRKRQTAHLYLQWHRLQKMVNGLRRWYVSTDSIPLLRFPPSPSPPESWLDDTTPAGMLDLPFLPSKSSPSRSAREDRGSIPPLLWNR